MDIGFVYILSNPAMPGLYKVGFTMRSPHARASELSSGTAVPCPFDVVMYWEVESPKSAETDIHNFLVESRCSQGREFFRCDLDFIIDAFRMHAFPYAEYENPDYISSAGNLAGSFSKEADHGTRKEH